MQRHLATFEAAHAGITRTRFLTLVAAARGFAQPRSRAASDALFLVSGAGGRFQIVQADSHNFSPKKVAQISSLRISLYSTILSRCGIIATIPRMDGVSGRSTT